MVLIISCRNVVTWYAFCDKPSPLYFYRGYYVRAKALSTVVTLFIEQYPSGCQVLSLGAGFDTAYFRLHTDGKVSSCKYFEVHSAGV